MSIISSLSRKVADMLYKRQFIEKASKEKAMRQLPMLPDLGEVIEFASNG